MKQIKLIAIFCAAYHVSFFAAEHICTTQQPTPNPAFKKLINQMLTIEREHAKINHQKIADYNNQFPKISQQEIDEWVANKEREIKENVEKRRKEQELQELKWQLEYSKNAAKLVRSSRRQK